MGIHEETTMPETTMPKRKPRAEATMDEVQRMPMEAQ
jgi:hypothetical protein